MCFEDIKSILNIASAISGLLAAGFWFYSAKVRAPYKDEIDDEGWTISSLTSIENGNEYDLSKTLKKQSYWSAWAAGSAAIAALCQATALIIGKL
jgi:hypothetical protein